MARPLPTEDSHRHVGGLAGRAAFAGPGRNPGSSVGRLAGAGATVTGLTADHLAELEHLRAENAQLHQLCLELEQALQEATQQGGANTEARIQEYEAALEDKTQTICALHQELEHARSQLAELHAGASSGSPHGDRTAPKEEELLALSEELERERRQLQEDEQSLMDQMREMEVGMARERAEIARQRNDLQRLQSEIRHEIERLERHGAVHNKIENVKSRLQDAITRRGAAPGSAASPPAAQPSPSQPTPLPQAKGASFMGRLFGKQ